MKGRKKVTKRKCFSLLVIKEVKIGKVIVLLRRQRL
jgi:hypothetical protein